MQVQKGSVVAAGAIVTPGKTVPSGEVWAGNPAKMLRKLEEEETGFIAQAANDYAALAAVHAAENAKTSEEIQVGMLRPRSMCHLNGYFPMKWLYALFWTCLALLTAILEPAHEHALLHS